jgi:hypothetical protein
MRGWRGLGLVEESGVEKASKGSGGRPVDPGALQCLPAE